MHDICKQSIIPQFSTSVADIKSHISTAPPPLCDTPVDSTVLSLSDGATVAEQSSIMESGEEFNSVVRKLIGMVENTTVPNLGNDFVAEPSVAKAMCCPDVPKSQSTVSTEDESSSVVENSELSLGTEDTACTIHIDTDQLEDVLTENIKDFPAVVINKASSTTVGIFQENCLACTAKIVELQAPATLESTPRVRKPLKVYGRHRKILPKPTNHRSPKQLENLQINREVRNINLASSVNVFPAQLSDDTATIFKQSETMEKEKVALTAFNKDIEVVETSDCHNQFLSKITEKTSNNFNKKKLASKTKSGKIKKKTFAYKHPNPAFVSFHSDKKTLIISDKKLKSLKETNTKSNVEKVKSAKLSKVSPNENSALSEIAQSRGKITRSFARLYNIANRDPVSFDTFVFRVEKPISLENSENICSSEATLEPVPLKQVNSIDCTSDKENAEENISVHTSPSITNKQHDLPLRKPSVENKNSPLMEQSPTQEYANPKKAIIRRYQQEITQSEPGIAESEVTAEKNQLLCNQTALSTNQETDLAKKFESEPSGVAESTLSKDAAGSHLEKLSDPPTSVENVEPISTNSNNKPLACKVVLSRCSPNKFQLTSPVTVASKLKLKLQNWKISALKKSVSVLTSPIQSKQVSTKTVGQQKTVQRASKNVRKRRTPFKCSFCIYSTMDLSLFAAHCHQMHSKDEKMYFCKSCDYVTYRESKLIAHTKIHQEIVIDLSENCKTSDQPLTNSTIKCKYEPVDEVIELPTTAPETPDSLKLKITDVKTLASAMEIGTPKSETIKSCNSKNTKFVERPYSCKICPYRAKKYYNLQVHIRSHTGTTKHYKCKHCPYAAARWKNYADHQQSTHSDLPLQCHTCDFSCFSPTSMKNHRISMHRKPSVIIQCDLCDMTYTRRDSFKAHYSTHSKVPSDMAEERPFKCPHCPFSAKRKAGLSKHLPVHAARKSIYMCKNCDFKSHMRSMLVRHTKQNYKCRNSPISPQK